MVNVRNQPVEITAMIRETVDRLCPCGSGEPSWWLCDARGIEVGRVCCKCEEEKRKHYREEIFTDPGYEADEPIEEE